MRSKRAWSVECVARERERESPSVALGPVSHDGLPLLTPSSPSLQFSFRRALTDDQAAPPWDDSDSDDSDDGVDNTEQRRAAFTAWLRDHPPRGMLTAEQYRRAVRLLVAALHGNTPETDTGRRELHNTRRQYVLYRGVDELLDARQLTVGDDDDPSLCCELRYRRERRRVEQENAHPERALDGKLASEQLLPPLVLCLDEVFDELARCHATLEREPFCKIGRRGTLPRPPSS